jgi:hypothetical protein
MALRTRRRVRGIPATPAAVLDRALAVEVVDEEGPGIGR